MPAERMPMRSRNAGRNHPGTPSEIKSDCWARSSRIRERLPPESALRNQKFADSPLEGSGFELPVPRCALIANSAALVAPPDSAVRGGSLNGAVLQPPIGGGPATA